MAGSTIPKCWRGYLTGTNRGKIFVLFNDKTNFLEGRVIFYDLFLGTTLIKLKGTREDRKTILKIDNCDGLPPIIPLDGELKLEFDSKFQTAQGDWNTDINTSGHCKIYSTEEWPIKWHYENFKKTFFLDLIKNLKYYYLLLIFTLVLSDVFINKNVSSISWATTFLVFIPFLFIFHNEIENLILTLSKYLRKAGPLAFRQPATPTNEPTPFPTDEPAPPTPDLKLSETFRFAYLNQQVFVPNTKSLLFMLRTAQKITKDQFTHYAKLLSVPLDNIDVTLSVLVASGCVSFQNGDIAITDFGEKFVDYLLKTN